jgi:hypothetical protein
MLDILSKLGSEFLQGLADQTSYMIRSEVDYVSSSLKAGIQGGIRDGFNSIRQHIFYLFMAMGATMVGLVFMVWGAAQVFAALFKDLGPEGTGYVVFGAVLLFIGMISFSRSKAK